VQESDCQNVFVKAQVLTGGRGKGKFSNGFEGGVHLAKNDKEAFEFGEKMLGHHLITKQSGPAGKLCKKVFVVEGISISKMLYAAFLLDRRSKGLILVVSKEGGMEIEQVASQNPSSILTFPVDIDLGISEEYAANIASILGIEEEKPRKELAHLFIKLFKIFTQKDATLVEINPIVLTPSNQVFCVDAKFTFDDNAAFRQREIFSLRDFSQEDSREVEASKFDLNYIGLDGNIGCLVNGAGLAMATMDLIKLNGGEPANFLDVGGSASAAQVKEAFRIICSDSRVKTILVNIFGGIMQCDVIAEGIIGAMKELNLQIPVTVRLQGTNFEKAKEMIVQSGLKLHFCQDFQEASLKAVELAA